MRENDTAVLRAMDVGVALVLLTRLPLPALPNAAFARQAQACWAFPLVGLVVGGAGACVAALALAVGLPASVVAGLCLGTQIILTGAMHEDGLADTADGFWGGWTVERRLDIMQDSRIGTYGVLAVIFSVGLRWTALSLLLSHALWPVMAIAIASRAGLPLLMARLPRVRPGGLSDRVGCPPMATALLSIGLGGVLLAALAGPAAIVLALATALALAGCAAIAHRKLGGQTGDVLGASQQVVETLCLMVLLTVLNS